MKKYHNIGYMMTDNIRNKTRYNLNISSELWVFHDVFNKISFVLWQPVLLEAEAVIPGENH
jgi:hypothetical protein